MKKVRLKPGDTVRVVSERGTAKIKAILPEVNGALLETAIGDFRNWNLDELRLVKRGKGRKGMSEEHRGKLAAKWRGIKRR